MMESRFSSEVRRKAALFFSITLSHMVKLEQIFAEKGGGRLVYNPFYPYG